MGLMCCDSGYLFEVLIEQMHRQAHDIVVRSMDVGDFSEADPVLYAIATRLVHNLAVIDVPPRLIS